MSNYNSLEAQYADTGRDITAGNVVNQTVTEISDSSIQRLALQMAYNQTTLINTLNQKSAHVMYWRKPDGFITIGPTMASNMSKYQDFAINKNFRALPERFGVEPAGHGEMHPNSPIHHNWLQPFFKAGGLTYRLTEQDYMLGKPGEYLMPAAQIEEIGLNKYEWVRKIRPDVKEWHPVRCHDCPSREFKDETDLRKHRSTVHKDTIATDALGRVITQAIASNNSTNVNDPNTLATVVAAAVQAALAATKGTPATEPESPAEYVDENGEWIPPHKRTVNKTESQLLDEYILKYEVPDSSWKRTSILKWMTQNNIEKPADYIKMTGDAIREYIYEVRPDLVSVREAQEYSKFGIDAHVEFSEPTLPEEVEHESN